MAMEILYKSADEVYQMILENIPCAIIDTLPEEHFNKVHISDARNACVYTVAFLQQIQELIPNLDETVIVYDSSERSQAAAVAADKMARAGYTDVYVLEGGLEKWKNANYPLTGELETDQNHSTTHLRLEDGSYTLDPDQSTIEWAGRNQNTTHFGTVNALGGEFSITDSVVTGGFDIDMQSIHNINLAGSELQPVLEAHLKSDDFFFVERFKTATLKIIDGKMAENAYLTCNNYRLKGKLTLKGVTSDLEFNATLTTAPEGSLFIEAHFDLDRTRWNVLYGSARFFEFLGMHQVFDDISIQLRLKMNKK